MLLLYYITLALLFIYGFLIRFYQRAWQQMPDFTVPDDAAGLPEIMVSVIVPARNEAEHIGKCLDALTQQSYPGKLIEIIVVNDHSTDDTAQIISNHHAGRNIRLINLSDHLDGGAINSYKKKAIEVAIAASTGQWIMATDADCIVPPDWISTMMAFQQSNRAVFVAAPVRITSNSTLLSIFQTLDFITLQGITGASVFKKFHSMCNGANLAYTRAAFYEAGGFTGIDDIASGDDMLLMHKIATRHPDRIFYLKSRDAIVSTLPAASWKAFFRQRIRWASKAGRYTDNRITAVLIIVYAINVLLLIFMAASLWHTRYLLLLLLLMLVKILAEYRFAGKVAGFFQQQHLMAYFILIQPLHIGYTVIAGWLGKAGAYEWKSRKVK